MDRPHNIEAEQALLGALLVNNEAVSRVADVVTPETFFEPLHGAIYERIMALHGEGRTASPVTLRPFFDGKIDAEIGGVGYLARLAGAAISVHSARDYAENVSDMAARREIIDAAEAAMEAARSMEATPAQTAQAAASRIETIAEKRKARELVVSWKRALTAAMNEVNTAYANDGPTAARTGLAGLDEALGGFYPGDLLLLGGRPSMGKSALASAFATNVAREGGGVLFCSLEMQTGGIALRAISEHLARKGHRVPYQAMRKGRLSETDMRAFVAATSEVEELPIMLTPPSIRDVGTLKLSIKRAAKMLEAKGKPLRLIVFDYLQIAEHPSERAVERLSEITKALKAAAMVLDVPVVALSQLSRQLESRDDKRPMMSDLRDSGTLEQDADVVMFVYRDEYYLERQKPSGGKNHDAELMAWGDRLDRARGKMEIIIAKQRMGALATVEVNFDAATNHIHDAQGVML